MSMNVPKNSEHQFVVTIRNIANIEELSDSEIRRAKQLVECTRVKPVSTSVCGRGTEVPYYWISCRSFDDCSTLLRSKFPFLRSSPGQSLDVRRSFRHNNCVYLRGIDQTLKEADVFDILTRGGARVDGVKSIHFFRSKIHAPYCALVGMKSPADVENALRLGEFRDKTDASTFTVHKSVRRSDPALKYAQSDVSRERPAPESTELKSSTTADAPIPSALRAPRSDRHKPQSVVQAPSAADVRDTIRAEIARTLQGHTDLITAVRGDVASMFASLTTRIDNLQLDLAQHQQSMPQVQVTPEAILSSRPYQELRTQLAQMRDSACANASGHSERAGRHGFEYS